MDKVSIRAYNFIKDNGIDTLPVMLEDLFVIAKRNKWHIGSYNKTVDLRGELSLHGIDTDKYVNTKDALAVLYDDEYMIFYKDSLDIDYKVFVILHEFAHIVLKHTYHGILGKASDEERTNLQEAEANAFAREVCAPLPVLYKCHFQSEKAIERFGLLKDRYAEEQFLILNKMGEDYCFSDIEKDIYKIFKSFVQHVKLFRVRGLVKRYIPVAIAFLMLGMLIMLPLIWKDSAPVSSEPLPYQQTAQELNSGLVPINETVYVTRTGEKYHVEGCQYIEGKDNLRDMTAEEAERAGYEPCSVCIR